MNTIDLPTPPREVEVPPHAVHRLRERNDTARAWPWSGTTSWVAIAVRVGWADRRAILDKGRDRALVPLRGATGEVYGIAVLRDSMTRTGAVTVLSVLTPSMVDESFGTQRYQVRKVAALAEAPAQTERAELLCHDCTFAPVRCGDCGAAACQHYVIQVEAGGRRVARCLPCIYAGVDLDVEEFRPDDDEEAA